MKKFYFASLMLAAVTGLVSCSEEGRFKKLADDFIDAVNRRDTTALNAFLPDSVDYQWSSVTLCSFNYVLNTSRSDFDDHASEFFTDAMIAKVRREGDEYGQDMGTYMLYCTLAGGFQDGYGLRTEILYPKEDKDGWWIVNYYDEGYLLKTKVKVVMRDSRPLLDDFISASNLVENEL